MDLHTKSPFQINASFRVMGTNLEPEAVSKSLGFIPDYSHRRGDPSIGSGGRRYADFREGIWILRSKNDSDKLENHLDELVNQLLHSRDALLKLIDSGFRADLFIGLTGLRGQYGYVLRQDLLRQIVDLRLILDFDIYSFSKEIDYGE